MELTVPNVYGLLLRSKLLSIEEAKAMFARWNEEAKDQASNLARFAAWMVANKYLTDYQASLLARGHAEGFFLANYKILDRLGKGRMAGVYKARHHLGQVVAIKVLPPSKAKEPTMLARFQREAKLALKLRHPNIVRGFQTGVTDGLNYLVMEHLDGETLEEILVRRTRLPAPEAVRLAYQVLQGLQHIHTQGLVHRDIKPSNLMLIPPPGNDSTVRCTVKILDIGLGRGVGFEEGSILPEDPGLTGEGVLLGTPDYMAPEQARDPRATDIRADVYALGCVLYHMLSGQAPFPDTNIISQMIRHATETPKSLHELNPSVPEGLEKIIGFMMAKDPAQRYPTPDRAAKALEMFLAAGDANRPLSAPDLDPQMQPFLTWVETENKKPVGVPAHQIPTVALPALAAPAAGKPAPGTIPTATPVPPPPAGVGLPPAPPSTKPPTGEMKAARRPDRVPGKEGGSRDAHARKKARKRRPPPIPGGSPDETNVVNVELVPVDVGAGSLPSPSAARAARKHSLALTRRDLLMFGLGVVGGVAALLAGMSLRSLFAKKDRPKDPDKNGDANNG